MIQNNKQQCNLSGRNIDDNNTSGTLISAEPQSLNKRIFDDRELSLLPPRFCVIDIHSFKKSKYKGIAACFSNYEPDWYQYALYLKDQKLMKHKFEEVYNFYKVHKESNK